MRQAWLIGLLALVGFTSANMAAVPTTPVAKVHSFRGKPSVVLTWTDTNAVAVVRTDVRRRSTGSDTTWKTVGFTTAKLVEFRDPGVYFGKTYRYQVRDSVAGSALTAWSDSVSIAVVSY
jgi:hypothetical protein